jgi:hypothetical protein
MSRWSKVDIIFFFLDEGLDVVLVVVLVLLKLLVLRNIVVDMAETHLCLHSLFLASYWVCKRFICVEFLLDCSEKVEAILRRIILHIFKQKTVDHDEGQLLERFHLCKIHLNYVYYRWDEKIMILKFQSSQLFSLLFVN